MLRRYEGGQRFDDVTGLDGQEQDDSTRGRAEGHEQNKSTPGRVKVRQRRPCAARKGRPPPHHEWCGMVSAPIPLRPFLLDVKVIPMPHLSRCGIAKVRGWREAPACGGGQGSPWPTSSATKSPMPVRPPAGGPRASDTFRGWACIFQMVLSATFKPPAPGSASTRPASGASRRRRAPPAAGPYA